MLIAKSQPYLNQTTTTSLLPCIVISSILYLM
jgi:hypothetical protein